MILDVRVGVLVGPRHSFSLEVVHRRNEIAHTVDCKLGVLLPRERLWAAGRLEYDVSLFWKTLLHDLPSTGPEEGKHSADVIAAREAYGSSSIQVSRAFRPDDLRITGRPERGEELRRVLAWNR